jgi:hypothetical protein
MTDGWYIVTRRGDAGGPVLTRRGPYTTSAAAARTARQTSAPAQSVVLIEGGPAPRVNPAEPRVEAVDPAAEYKAALKFLR